MVEYHNDFVDDPVRQCVGKRQYRSKKVAKNVHRQLATRGVEFRSALHPYKCPHCGYFHLGRKRNNKGTA